MNNYAFTVEVRDTLPAVQERLQQALANERLGIVSEIDVQGILKARMGVEMPGYRILGACAPTLAKRVIDAEAQAGALLPCNIVLRELDADRVAVDFMDPVTVLDLADAEDVKRVGREAREILQRVAASLKED